MNNNTSSWDLYGTDKKNTFLESLKPKNLEEELQEYRKIFGISFKINDLIKIKEIESNAMIAESIANAPEFLLDQISKYRLSDKITIVDALDAIANSIAGSWKN